MQEHTPVLTADWYQGHPFWDALLDSPTFKSNPIQSNQVP